MREVDRHTGSAYSIGITGVPGSGKSTIVDGVVSLAREQDMTVGVIAVDPTSSYSGGAVLGDRVRMQRHYLDPGVFIRSLATRGIHGGLSQIASAAARLLDAAGKDLVIVETVGVGQTELDIRTVSDTVVVTMVPEGGDSVQTMKAGLMEIADIYVVNKADREGADRLRTTIHSFLSTDTTSTTWNPPVLMTEAHTMKGIPELFDSVLRHRKSLEDSGILQSIRRQRRRGEYAAAITGALNTRLLAMVREGGLLDKTLFAVESGKRDPYGAAADTLADPEIVRNLTTSPSGSEWDPEKGSC